jgi:hypothetical protein
MAKRRARRNIAKRARTARQVEAFAEDLGRVLGTARSRVEGWLSQRNELAHHLAEIRDTASQLLTSLGHRAERVLRRRGRPAKHALTGEAADTAARNPVRARRRRRKISAEARARMSAAQKARWAKARKQA